MFFESSSVILFLSLVLAIGTPVAAGILVGRRMRPGSAIALAVLALHLTLIGRGVTSSLMATVVVVLILFVSFDLDRPQRGLITVPFGPLTDVRSAMDLTPAADGP